MDAQLTKTKTTVLIISILVSLACNQAKDLSEDEIYSILNEIIADDSLRLTHTVNAEFSDPTLDREAKCNLTGEDLKFVNRQISLFADLCIKPNKLNRRGWQILQKKSISPFVRIIASGMDTILHTNFSFPIISRDRKKVILTIGYGGCFMCGGHGTYLFEKINGKWRQTKSWNEIIV